MKETSLDRDLLDLYVLDQHARVENFTMSYIENSKNMNYFVAWHLA